MTSPCILITGANRGIGLESCRQFARDDWRVLACCRNPDESEALQSAGPAQTGQFLEYDGINIPW